MLVCFAGMDLQHLVRHLHCGFYSSFSFQPRQSRRKGFRSFDSEMGLLQPRPSLDFNLADLRANRLRFVYLFSGLGYHDHINSNHRDSVTTKSARRQTPDQSEH